MANECNIFEMRSPRNGDMPIRTVPFLAKQQLSTTGVSAALNPSTTMITVFTTLAGTIEFSRISGSSLVDPDGAGITFPLLANTLYDFDVRPGIKVRFV